MNYKEFQSEINKNRISVEIQDGKLHISPREISDTLVKLFKKYAQLIAAEKKGSYKDWQGKVRKCRKECENIGHCWACEEFYPLMEKDGQRTGLCLSREPITMELQDSERRYY